MKMKEAHGRNEVRNYSRNRTEKNGKKNVNNREMKVKEGQDSTEDLSLTQGTMLEEVKTRKK